jgi:hypothetical protein
MRHHQRPDSLVSPIPISIDHYFSFLITKTWKQKPHHDGCTHLPSPHAPQSFFSLPIFTIRALPVDISIKSRAKRKTPHFDCPPFHGAPQAHV